ncbi:heme o synthase [Shewanella surugensis]|uniref:Protoheme IX farnesyltransferase n=1 Tax=Shewanella surugensis TaxID=212020 RepID=A0ABT0L9P8_9GAMM|nr:heme o synthase [Shewanella surugensis]MCL1124441.1 heme o synthase [Shewanella surugensis]
MDHVQPQNKHDALKLSSLISVTKPGIILGNLITVIGCFFLASKGEWHGDLLFKVIIGISLVIASGCVFNNYIDKDIDKLMERTQGRVMVLGLLPDWFALSYGLLLGGLGFAFLASINVLTLVMGAIGFIFYVGIYSLWAKRHTEYGTVIGAVSGAMPMAVGYCAVSNHLDAGVLTLIVISILWQIPHSYAIGVFRSKDYRSASIPILSVTRAISTVKVHSLAYIVAFSVACVALYVLGYAGVIYLTSMLLLSAWWMKLAWAGFSAEDDKKWAKKMFFFSIIIISIFSLLIGLGL